MCLAPVEDCHQAPTIYTPTHTLSPGPAASPNASARACCPPPQVSSEDAIEGMAYYIALYLSRAPEARNMEPKQLQAALRQTMTVRGGLGRRAFLVPSSGSGCCIVSSARVHPNELRTNGDRVAPWCDTLLTCSLFTGVGACVCMCAGDPAQPLPSHLGLGPLPVPLGCGQLQRAAAVRAPLASEGRGGGRVGLKQDGFRRPVLTFVWVLCSV